LQSISGLAPKSRDTFVYVLLFVLPLYQVAEVRFFLAYSQTASVQPNSSEKDGKGRLWFSFGPDQKTIGTILMTKVMPLILRSVLLFK